MKIAIFTHNYPESVNDRQNAGYFVYDLAEELTKKAEVKIFCPHESLAVEKNVGNTKVFWFKRGTKNKLGSINLISPFAFLGLVMFFARGTFSIPKFYSKYKPDISIAMWAWPSGFFTLLAKYFYKTPYVIWALGSDINKYAKWPVIGFFFKKILTEASILFADGVTLSSDVEKICGKKCIFLPSATKIDTKHSKLHKHKNKKIVLTFLGRMEKVKGPDIFLETLASLDKEILAKYKINFVGDGSLLKDLQEIAQKNNIKNITFYGNVSDKSKIVKILSSSDWVIIPSRGDSVPLVFSESMKSSTPIIASSLPDISYLIKKYKVGLIFKTEDPEDLAKVISILYTKRSQRSLLAKNTSKAAKDFSVEASSKKLYNYILSVVNYG